MVRPATVCWQCGLPAHHAPWWWRNGEAVLYLGATGLILGAALW